jgi:hypothetical protein
MKISRLLGVAIRSAAFFAVLTPALLSTTQVHAEDMTVVIRNDHPNALELEFYSQDRDHVWPGDNKVYYLDDGETKEIPISCRQGENICYGAWISNDKQTYWGTGPDNEEDCSDCCYTCDGGQTEEIQLTK